MGKTSKLWKSGGFEDKFLEKLYKQGKVTKCSTPAAVKNEYPHIFKDYSLAVVRNHFNDFKRRNGIYLSGASDDIDQIENDENFELHETDNELQTINEPELSSSSGIQHMNYPFKCEKYVNPVTEVDMIILAVLMPSGSQNIELDVNDSGTQVIISYNWSKTLFTVEDLFKTDLQYDQIYHPRILAIKNGLKKNRAKMDISPKAAIHIKLPMKVETAPSSWTKKGIQRKDGTQIIIAEFQGHINMDYIKKKDSAAVKFENPI